MIYIIEKIWQHIYLEIFFAPISAVESMEDSKNLESHIAIITMRQIKAIIAWRCCQNWKENLLVYCFPANLVSISFFFVVVVQRCIFSVLHCFHIKAVFPVQIPYLVHYCFEFFSKSWKHTHTIFFVPGCHCGMSVRFTEEFSMNEFSTLFSYLAGLFLVVEQLMWVNVCAVVPAGRSSTDLSIFSFLLSSLVLHFCSGMQQRSE